MADILDAAQTNTPASPVGGPAADTTPVEPPPPVEPPASSTDSLIVPPPETPAPEPLSSSPAPPVEKPASPVGGPKKKSRLGVLLAGLLLLVIALPILWVAVQRQVEIRSRAASGAECTVDSIKGVCLKNSECLSPNLFRSTLQCPAVLSGCCYNPTTTTLSPPTPITDPCTPGSDPSCSALGSGWISGGRNRDAAEEACIGVCDNKIRSLDHPDCVNTSAIQRSGNYCSNPNWCYKCSGVITTPPSVTPCASPNFCALNMDDCHQDGGTVVSGHTCPSNRVCCKPCNTGNCYNDCVCRGTPPSTCGQQCAPTGTQPTTTTTPPPGCTPGACNQNMATSCNIVGGQCIRNGRDNCGSCYIACNLPEGCGGTTPETTPTLTTCNECSTNYDYTLANFQSEISCSIVPHQPVGTVNYSCLCSCGISQLHQTYSNCTTLCAPPTVTPPPGIYTCDGCSANYDYTHATWQQTIACSAGKNPISDTISYNCQCSCPATSGIAYTPPGSASSCTTLCSLPPITPSITVTPPTRTPTPPTQCIAIVVYDQSGNALSQADLEKLQPGATITLAFAPGGAATKARFSINGGAWMETSTKNANGQFILGYTLPAAITSYTIRAEWFDGSVWSGDMTGSGGFTPPGRGGETPTTNPTDTPNVFGTISTWISTLFGSR